MDAATLDRIYDPFFTTKEVGRGTGLGLAIVQRIVANLAGTITVTSTPGVGTTFTLYFPAHDRGSRVESATAVAATIGRGEQVLLLDDEPALVNVGKRILERAGYRVTGFTHVAAALEALRGRPCSFDVVMTDFNMPGASGVDVARQVSKDHPDLPIVLLSGVLSESIEDEARAAGVHHVIGKPYKAEQLPAAVALVLGEARRHGGSP